MQIQFQKSNWIYDIEIYKNFFLVCLQNINTLEKKSFQISQYKSEKNNLVVFLQKEVNSMIGFNNLQFDYPLLHFLIKNINNYPNDKQLVFALYAEAQRLISSIVSFFNIIKEPHFKQIDLYKIHHYDNPAKSNSLKHLEFNLKMDNIQELPYPYDEILTYEQQQEVIKYCWNDIEATYQFYLKSVEEITLRENLTKEYNIDFTNHSSSKIGEVIFITEFEKTGKNVVPDTLKPMAIKDLIFKYVKFTQPCFNVLLDWFNSKVITETKGVFSNIDVSDLTSLKPYMHEKLVKGKQKDLNIVYKDVKIVYGTGGIHGSTKAGIYESTNTHIIKTCDVASLYPNLGIRNKVFPIQLSEKFCEIYESLYEKRKTFAKGTVMNLAIKLCLNATYGKSNSAFSKLYSPPYAMTITINGQLLLTMLMEMLCENIPGIELLMINTDGIEVKIPKEFEGLYYEICKEWEALTKLDLEYGDYQKMIIANVNNYIAVDTKGKIKRKGAMFIYVIRDGELEYHKNHSSLVIQKALEQYFIHNVSPEKYILEQADVYDFFKRVKLKGNCKLVKRKIDLIPIEKTKKTKIQRYNEIILEEKPLPKITRYYVSKTGWRFIKILPPLKSSKTYLDRESNIEVDVLCTNCNILSKERLDFIKTDIDYNWYINQVNKIITKIQNQEEIDEE